MLVDDEDFLIELYRDVLTLRGYQVLTTAYDGEEAVRKFASLAVKPDVLLLDHRMPIMSGIEALREILRMRPEQKVLMATADRSIEDEVKNLGKVTFMPKPFAIEELIEAMNSLLKQKH